MIEPVGADRFIQFVGKKESDDSAGGDVSTERRDEGNHGKPCRKCENHEDEARRSGAEGLHLARRQPAERVDSENDRNQKTCKAQKLKEQVGNVRAEGADEVVGLFGESPGCGRC
jgi:hypothetical protein